MSVRFLAEAEQDLEEAAAYYEGQRAELGREFALAIAEGIDRISETPRAWHPFGTRTRRYRLKRFPYGHVYHLLDNNILVLAVAHHSRAPDYWHNRLPQDQQN